VGRERLLLAGGPAALLMQVAHPLVAAGVSAHSDFEADPLRRLRGTMGTTLTVTFGDASQAEAAVSAVARRHRSVRGGLPARSGDFAAGTPYRADDPDLALWVYATLVWSAVRVADLFLPPLTEAQRDAYTAEMRAFGALFGAHEEAMPSDYAALDRLVRQRLDDVLVVGPVAHELADRILRPEPPLLPVPVRGLPSLLAAALLPEELREAYGLAWRRRERLLFAVVRTAIRVVRPLLPGPVRFWPHYRLARQRLAP
jgi:uncharacterized protein (DUF2236 family)